MSNVLIGIIGVILFIGLALTGALFLGPRFQTAANESKAAAIVNQMTQISSAVSMYQLQTGQIMKGSTYSTNVTSLVPDFLRNAPTKDGQRVYDVVDPQAYGTDSPVKWVTTTIPGEGDSSRDVCIAINRHLGHADPISAMGQVERPEQWGPFAMQQGRGCMKYTAGGLHYTVFMPV